MNKSKIAKAHQPCPCGKSSDAYSIREDGTGFCFSCNKNFEKEFKISNKEETTQQFMQWRGISKNTMEKFRVVTTVTAAGDIVSVGFPYPNGRVKHRSVNKQFWFTGDKVQPGELFGADLFPAGSSKAITVTEGELDAMSVYEMMGGYPVVSLQSSSVKLDKHDYDYLNSFEKIYLCLDNDNPGIEARNRLAKLFDFNKIYIVNLTKKDANEYLQSNEVDTFRKIWWGSKRYLPEGIISSYSEFDEIIDSDEFKPSVPYPFPSLEDKTYGIRLGEFNLFTAKEGIGKTEVFRALEYNILKTTEDNIGIIHLEESKARSIKGLVGYEVSIPIHLPDRSIPNADIKSTFRKITRRDDRVHIYSHFGSDDPDTILSVIRFLAGACGCKYIFLDHLTMVVTGLQGEDERRALDYISTRLAMMVEELDFCLFCISHENDEGLTRGSRNISKVSDLWIQLIRNPIHEDEDQRNITKLLIKKNRFSGKTGYSGKLRFDPDTYVLTEELELPQ